MNEIQLYHKDCIEFLKDLKSNSIDLVLIDPPYFISRSTGFQSCGIHGVERFKISYQFGEWDNQIFNLQETFNECHRILKNSGTIICFYDIWKIETLKNWLEKSNFKQLRFLEWIKTNPVPINSKINYLTNAREIALSATKKSKPTFNSQYDNGIYHFPICHEKDRFHPTQKPLNLIEELIKKHSNENDIVLDCFAGSGTTAIACHNTKRNFIGCELDETYYNKATNRINNHKEITNEI